MKKRDITTVFIIALLVSNLAILHNYINLVDKTNFSLIKLQSENSQLRRMIDYNDKTEITELITNDNIDSVFVNNEVIDCPILVSRFFSGGYYSCTDSLLSFFNRLSPEIKNNLLTISNYSTDSELNAVLYFKGARLQALFENRAVFIKFYSNEPILRKNVLQEYI